MKLILLIINKMQSKNDCIYVNGLVEEIHRDRYPQTLGNVQNSILKSSDIKCNP